MRSRIFILGMVIVCSLRVVAADGGGEGLRAGVAKVVITPEFPMWLNGYAGRDVPSSAKLHDIWAKALVVEDGAGGRSVIVTTDLLGLSHAISMEVARKVDSLYGIRRDQLLLNSSHTHSAPVVWPCADVIYDLGPDDLKMVSLYGQQLTEKLVKVIGMAVGNLAPARLSSGWGSAEFAINRRNAIHANGPVDHAVPVLKVEDGAGRLEAVLFGYACHNTTLVETNFFVNGDYAGFAQIALEAKHPGVQAMFFQGCAGDQNPAPRGTVEYASAHGQELADAVEKVLSSGGMSVVSGPVRTAYTTVDLPFRKFDPAIYQAAMVGNNKYEQRRAKLMLDGYNRGVAPDHVVYPVQAVRYGHALCFLALSDEVVVDYSLRAKREFAGEHLFVAGYSSEVMCYIPSQRVLGEGGYEPDESMIYYGWPGPFADGVEERVFGGIRLVMKKVGAR